MPVTAQPCFGFGWRSIPTLDAPDVQPRLELNLWIDDAKKTRLSGLEQRSRFVVCFSIERERCLKALRISVVFGLLRPCAGRRRTDSPRRPWIATLGRRADFENACGNLCVAGKRDWRDEWRTCFHAEA
jgi:hypothetical protein